MVGLSRKKRIFDLARKKIDTLVLPAIRGIVNIGHESEHTRENINIMKRPSTNNIRTKKY